MNTIELRKVVKSFGPHRVLTHLDLAIPSGKFVAIIGPSGCGKSTLLKIISNLVEPDTGQVLIHGHNLSQLNAGQVAKIRRQMGMVFQQSPLFDARTVAENLSLVFEYDNDLTETDVVQRLHNILTTVNLAGYEDRMPSCLSGGEKKRVAIALAIIHQPSIMLYDEPTLSLDPHNKKLAMDVMASIHHARPGLITSVIVSHDLDTMSLVDEVLLLQNGRLYSLGKPQNLDRQFLIEVFQGDATGVSERRCP